MGVFKLLFLFFKKTQLQTSEHLEKMQTASKVRDRSQLASSYIVSKRLIRIPFVRKTIEDKTHDVTFSDIHH